MNGDDENRGGDPNHADNRISKRKEYNKLYYASRKDAVVSRAVAEKRRIANKKYYEYQKEIKMRKLANGEGSSRSTLATNISEVDMLQMNTKASERTPLGTLNARRINNLSPSVISNSIELSKNMANSTSVPVALNKENISPYEEILGTHLTTSQPIQSRSRLTHENSKGIQMRRRTLLPLFDEVMDEASTGYCTRVNDDPPIMDTITQEDPYAFVYDGVPREYRVLAECCTCPHCGAKRFKFEFPTFCCMSGKTKLVSRDIPEELYDLFTAQSELGKIFRNNIRAYNTNFSFTSMGVNLDERYSNLASSGVYTFRVSGGIYHRIDQLVPRNGQPKYLQLYFYDSEVELSHRCEWENLNKDIIKILMCVLATNPYVRTFRSLHELGQLEKYSLTLNASVEIDQRHRQYNRPTTSEVAGIWVEGNNYISAYKRDIVVYGRSEFSQTIEPYFGCYDPLSYVLFFPNGEPGWHPRILRVGASLNEIGDEDENMDPGLEDTNSTGRKTVTMREDYCYKFQIRPEQNVILLGGRLLQQFVVDVYIKIETSRLAFCELHQSKIRADLYQGVVDCVNAGEVQPTRVGKRVVLPASFIGGPRDMRRRFLDAMTLVQDDGKPDIFLTMTCNPKWPEILEALEPGQEASDRPDVVARVFRAKLEDLKDQLFKRHVLGVVGAHVYVVEFQKRGLPHAHFLLIMTSEYKMNNPDHYDKMVCAEIPDPVKYPRMHEMVVKHMMHGPCGHLRPSSTCMEGEPKQCRWRYPRQFNEKTIQGEDSYPLYRRRNTGVEVNVRQSTLDNRWVVPYNPKLLMMYNCHINVEVCSSIKSVKYVFKYVYKGHDKQVIHIDPDGDEEQVINEVKNYQDVRYVSPPEAMWRIFSFPLSQIYPYVMPLQLHLPNMQLVRFQDDPWFSDFLLRVGNGVEEAIDGSYIRIPDDMAITYTNDGNSRDDLINAIFPSLETNTHSSEYITSRAILSTKNENVDEINDQLIGRFHGEEKIYYSYDEAEDDNNNFYPVEFLNSLNVSGLPPHYLRLKIGCPIILLRNIDPPNGLCNGTRLICKGFQPNVIDAEIAVGQHAGKRVFLPRIPLCPSEDDMFPFKLKRKQFPVRLSFDMTINKAQGQTIPNVGVYLPDSVFSHGQLYVALSRGISRETTKVLVRPTKQFRQDGVYTSNVVYKEVLNDK